MSASESPPSPQPTPPHVCRGGPLHDYRFIFTRPSPRIFYPGGYYHRTKSGDEDMRTIWLWVADDSDLPSLQQTPHESPSH